MILKKDRGDSPLDFTKVSGQAFKRVSLNIIPLTLILVTATSVATEDYRNKKDELSREVNGVITSEPKNGIVKVEPKLEPAFDKEDVRTKSNISISDLERVLKNTNLHELSSTFILAEEVYQVNSLFLLGLVSLESGHGKSRRSIEDNNLTGYAVYSDSSRGAVFESKEENILATAQLISEEYLKEHGQYFNGYSVEDINKKYSADENWHKKIIDIASDYRNKISLWNLLS